MLIIREAEQSLYKVLFLIYGRSELLTLILTKIGAWLVTKVIFNETGHMKKICPELHGFEYQN